MIKYFELLLELLDIQESNRAKYIDIAKIIESQKYSDLICYHRHAIIFEGYKKLLDKKITTEEFTQIGDFKSKIFFDIKKQDSISFLHSMKSNTVLDDNTLYIFDDISKGIVEDSKNTFYC